MEEVKRIYILLLHSNGLKIKDIAKELNLDKYYVADIMFSTDNIPFWYQDSSTLWFAIDGAIEIDEPKEDKLTAPILIPKVINTERFLQGDTSAALRNHLRHLSNFRVYSDKELVELFRRYRDGDEKSYELIVKSLQKLVAGIAVLYSKYGIPLEDLIQEGNIGLIRAIERFDHIHFRGFNGFAKSGILQAISTSITSLPYMVRLPISKLALYRKTRKFKEMYEQKYEYNPSITEIEIGEDIDLKNLSYINNLPDDLRELVHREDNWDDYPSIDFPADDIVMKESRLHIVKSMLSKLKHREAEILRRAYGIGVKVEDLSKIGEHMGLTRERIRQIKEKAIKILRDIAKSKITVKKVDIRKKIVSTTNKTRDLYEKKKCSLTTLIIKRSQPKIRERIFSKLLKLFTRQKEGGKWSTTRKFYQHQCRRKNVMRKISL